MASQRPDRIDVNNLDIIFEKMIIFFNFEEDVNKKRDQISALHCKIQREVADNENKIYLTNFLLARTREMLRAELYMRKMEKGMSDKMIENFVENSDDVKKLLEEKRDLYIVKNKLDSLIKCFEYAKSFLMSKIGNQEDIKNVVIATIKSMKGNS